MRLTTLACLLVTMALGCGGGGDDDDVVIDATQQTPDAPAQVADAAVVDGVPGTIDAAPCTGSHTENMNGVCHMPGKEDPLANCTTCHGATLTGGSGPSCYTCHNNDDHTINRAGRMHRTGDTASCTACHGPNNTGGLGPACSSCH